MANDLLVLEVHSLAVAFKPSDTLTEDELRPTENKSERASGPFHCACGVLNIPARWLQGLHFTAAEE